MRHDRARFFAMTVDHRSAAERWDHLSVHGIAGTDGDYVLAKVGRAFPDLAGISGIDS